MLKKVQTGVKCYATHSDTILCQPPVFEKMIFNYAILEVN